MLTTGLSVCLVCSTPVTCPYCDPPQTAVLHGPQLPYGLETTRMRLAQGFGSEVVLQSSNLVCILHLTLTYLPVATLPCPGSLSNCLTLQQVSLSTATALVSRAPLEHPTATQPCLSRTQSMLK
jgi:hypothetical protein